MNRRMLFFLFSIMALPLVLQIEGRNIGPMTLKPTAAEERL
jgi:hypothetical protein